MKKFAVILLSVSLLFCTAGCLKEPLGPTTEPSYTEPIHTTPTETTVETHPAELPDLPLLVFSAPVHSQQHRADDGVLLFSYAYQDFSLILEDPQIADAIVVDLLNHIDFENSAAKSVFTDAQAAYDGQSDWIPFAYSSYFSPERFDQGVLSLYGVHALYSGSPRSTTVSVSISYDLLTGRQLALRDILTEDFSADKLSQLITESLRPLSEQGMLFSDYAYVVSELFATNRPVDCWYFSENGLCFYFAPYEIAPYSSGTITAEIPYTELTGLLRDEYFPAEATEFTGASYIQPFQDANLGQFNRFAELVVDENGSQYLLYTDGCLQDVRFELGSWLDDGSFLTEATVFASPALCAGDGVMIQIAADSVQALRLTYKNNGEDTTIDLSAAITDN